MYQMVSNVFILKKKDYSMKLSQKENELISTLAKCENIQNAREYYLNLLEFKKDLFQE